MQDGRPKRVGEEIRKEISAMIAKGLKDPRIGFVSVMAVNMSPDLKYATIYVSLYGSESARKSSLIALRQSAGWIRREIGKRMRLRFTPEIRFLEDTTLEDASQLDEVFKKLHEEESEDSRDD